MVRFRGVLVVVVVALLPTLGLGPALAAPEKPAWSPGDYWEFVGWDNRTGIRMNLTERVEILGFETLVRPEGTHDTVKVEATQAQDQWWTGVTVTLQMTQWYRRADLSLLRERWVSTANPPGNTTLDITIDYDPPWLLYRFPLDVGAEWRTDSTFTVTGLPPNTTVFVPYTSEHRVVSSYDYTLPSGSGGDPNGTFRVHVIDRENATPGGPRWRYLWAEAAGFWVRHELHAGNGTAIQELSLTSHRYASVAASADRGRHAAGRWLVAPLYTRLRKEDVLDQFTRGRIFGHIEAHTGASFSEIQRTLRLPHGSLSYHLSVLEREGLIRSHPAGTRRVFFPAGRAVDDDSPSAIQTAILRLVDRSPGVSIGELGTQLGLTRQRALYHARRLGAAEMIVLRRPSLTLRCYPARVPPGDESPGPDAANR